MARTRTIPYGRDRDWVKGKLTQDIEYTFLSADINKPVDPAVFRIDGLDLADGVAVLDRTVGRTIGRIRDLRPGQAQSGLDALLAVDSQDPIKPLAPKEDPRVAACERKEARQDGKDSLAGAPGSRVIFAWGALIGGLILAACGALLFWLRRGSA